MVAAIPLILAHTGGIGKSLTG